MAEAGFTRPPPFGRSITRSDDAYRGAFVYASLNGSCPSAWQVTRDQLYAWVGIPRATATRKLRLQGTLNQDESERVLGLARLIGHVQQIVAESGDDRDFDAGSWTAAWLSQPVPALGGRCPGEFVDTADGRELIAGLLARMQSGAYA